MSARAQKRSAWPTRLLGRLCQDQSGTASIEFGVVVSTLLMIMLNGIEVARYYFLKMELQNAVQTAGQAVWNYCNTSTKLPTSTACSGVSTKITNALQSTSLGSSVSLSSGYPSEGYYCINSSTGAFSYAGTTSPSNCSAYGGSTSQYAGYYIRIQAGYTYAPLYSTVSIGSTLPTALTASSMTRLK
jgi:Flp pilus assembly protein TadG